MATLRAPDGCAWDRQQTHESLRGYLLEETYEAIEAIDAGRFDDLEGELGDVLLQCVFHAQLATEAGRFDIAAVVTAIGDKLIRRHPHIFAPDGRRLTARERQRYQASTPGAVREQWARLKAGEQGRAGQAPRVLGGVPRALPALLRAHKIGARVAAVGFDWPSTEDVMAKIDEEVRELREALHESPARATEEFGDLLFAIANLARKLGIDPEATLSAANDKFTRRFDAIEARLQARDRDVHDASLDELEAEWAAVKLTEAAASRPATSARARSASTPSRRRTRSSPPRPGRS
ncbi:MAG: nucleoside triphosphate pyrophosphohydrolase [Acidobacteria bacterium SCN 69-37]|nr:MAG: nucleoside triphosphate pyrophosphohydrolase [Acidobacteria bacterium SCN 69-37]